MSQRPDTDDTVWRRDDMSPDDMLMIHQQRDGDLAVSIINRDGFHSVEFCSLAFGGGRSQHTREALIKLMEAIRLDNIERPIP